MTGQEAPRSIRTHNIQNSRPVLLPPGYTIFVIETDWVPHSWLNIWQHTSAITIFCYLYRIDPWPSYNIKNGQLAICPFIFTFNFIFFLSFSLMQQYWFNLGSVLQKFTSWYFIMWLWLTFTIWLWCPNYHTYNWGKNLAMSSICLLTALNFEPMSAALPKAYSSWLFDFWW